MNDLEEKKKKRFQFLNKLYEMTEGNTKKPIEPYKIGGELGIDGKTIRLIVDYLCEERLIEGFEMGSSSVFITHYGVLEVEEALSQPNEPTEHFLPFNIINVTGDIINSQFQQASPGAKQEISILNENELQDLGEIIQSLKDSVDQFNLDPQQKSDFQAEIQTIEAQMSSSKPKRSIIKESFHSIRNISEGVVAGLIASGLLPKISAIIEKIQ